MFNKEEMSWFSSLNCKELKAELKARKFKGYSKMKKAQLKDALLDILEQEKQSKTNAREEKELNDEELSRACENRGGCYLTENDYSTFKRDIAKMKEENENLRELLKVSEEKNVKLETLLNRTLTRNSYERSSTDKDNIEGSHPRSRRNR